MTKDEYKSRLTSAITGGVQSVYHQRLDTSDYGELLLEQRWPCRFNFVYLHVDANIHLINAIFWANVLLHIATVIQFNFEKQYIDNIS